MTDDDKLIITPGDQAQKVRESVNHDGERVHQVLTTIAETPEEHVYLFYKPKGTGYKEVVLEADLVGDQTTYKSDGSLPPVIHIECPRCTSPSDRRAMSVTHYRAGGLKHFEIEDLDPDRWYTVCHPDTGEPLLSSEGRPVLQTRHLTIKEVITCKFCNHRFKITDCRMSDA